MHLNECFAVALAAAGAASGSVPPTVEDGTMNHTAEDLHECFSGWLFKSTTNFYGSEELHLPWWFGLFCLNFSLGGFVMLVTMPRWAKASRFPYVTFAFILMFLQGPLSFMADYMNMTEDSLWHAIDRFMAAPLMLLEVLKIVTMFPHVRSGTLFAYSLACGLAVTSFLSSQAAQSRHDADGFVFWHNMWHAYPLIVSVVTGFDFFVLGEYDAAAAVSSVAPNASASQSARLDSPRPKLLSTVVMEQSAHVPPSSPRRGGKNLRARVGTQR